MKKTLFTLLSIAALCAADSAVAQQGRRGRRAAAQTGGGRRAAAPVAQAGRRGRGVVPVVQRPVYRAPVVEETIVTDEVSVPANNSWFQRHKGKLAAGGAVLGAAALGGAAVYGTKKKLDSKLTGFAAGTTYKHYTVNDRMRELQTIATEISQLNNLENQHSIRAQIMNAKFLNIDNKQNLHRLLNKKVDELAKIIKQGGIATGYQGDMELP